MAMHPFFTSIGCTRLAKKSNPALLGMFVLGPWALAQFKIAV
jgi:hypothetical protein